VEYKMLSMQAYNYCDMFDIINNQREYRNEHGGALFLRGAEGTRLPVGHIRPKVAQVFLP